MNEDNQWLQVKKLMGEGRIQFGAHVSYWCRKSPRRLLYSVAYYKFAAKLIGAGKRVLDVGCAEGIGTWLLAKECGMARGLDLDADAIAAARSNWRAAGVEFGCEDFLRGQGTGEWDAVTSFDVIEHMLPEHAGGYWQTICSHLRHDGIAIIGTPNITGQQYASEIAKRGHVNCYSGERLEEEMQRSFHHVFMFGANDEVVHTGFLPMAHYLIAVGCRKRV